MLTNEKELLREKLKCLRRDIGEKQRLEKNQAIQQRLLSMPEYQQAMSAFCFISYGSEVDTHNIIRSLIDTDTLVAVPKISSDADMQAIKFPGWDALKPGQLGIPSPDEDLSVISHFDIIITPGLGFSVAGERIGFGRGYYDRWFAAHKQGIKIALAYDEQIVDNIPSDENDEKVDFIVTDARLIKVSPLASLS